MHLWLTVIQRLYCFDTATSFKSWFVVKKAAKGHEIYTTCRVQIVCQLVSLLLEAVYGIAHNKIAVHGDSEAYSSPKLVRHSNILNDKKFSCVKSNSAIFKNVNANYVMSYPIYFK